MSQQATVVGKECRFAIHMPTFKSDVPDCHLVKENVHYSDGTTKPNIVFKFNYMRPFGVTAKPFRNHEQKKEYETTDKLLMHSCTQSELAKKVAQALDLGWQNRPNLRQLAASPYLYGSDISSSSLIKADYAKQYPDSVSGYSIAYYDIETNMLGPDEDPVMATVVFKDKIFTAIDKKFLEGYASPYERLEKMLSKHLQAYIEKYKFTVEFFICDNAGEVIQRCIMKTHEWSPDFLAIWNIDFDIPKSLITLEKFGIDPKDVFSDPRVPKELRFCKYKKGSVMKVTASGQQKPKNPSEQWHSLYCPAGFYPIDAMSSYRFVRQGEQELPYYKLDFVLNHELGIRKLNFPEADEVEDGTPDWHIFMQSKYPFEYVIYNIFDCIGMLELETKNNDLSTKLPIQCGFTDFPRFNSQTKKFADDYHFFLLRQDKLIGTIGPVVQKVEGASDDEVPSDDEDDDEQPRDEDDDEDLSKKNEVLGLKKWIVTLPAHMSMLGKRLIDGMKSIATLIRAFVYDSDAVSAYPSATAVANVSRETTVREIIEILGVDEEDFRRQNINLLQGHVNAIEYACVMHQLPKPQDALKLFDDMGV